MKYDYKLSLAQRSFLAQIQKHEKQNLIEVKSKTKCFQI